MKLSPTQARIVDCEDKIIAAKSAISAVMADFDKERKRHSGVPTANSDYWATLGLNAASLRNRLNQLLCLLGVE